MERNMSGDISDSDVPLTPVSITGENSSSNIIVKESCIDDDNSDEDGILKEVEKALDGKNDRRRKLKSVLKNKTPTPVIITGDYSNDEASHATSPADDIRMRRTESPSGRNCCVIL